MKMRYVVVVLPELDLNASVTGPFRSREKAQRVSESIERAAGAQVLNGLTQVVPIGTVAEIRRLVKETTK